MRFWYLYAEDEYMLYIYMYVCMYVYLPWYVYIHVLIYRRIYVLALILCQNTDPGSIWFLDLEVLI